MNEHEQAGAPGRIWLQTGCDEPECDDYPCGLETHRLDEITWCMDRINPNDTAYVLAAPADALVDLLLRARQNVEHVASHPLGVKSRELLAEIDAALARYRETTRGGENG